MATYETELLNRLCALELEAMTSIGVRADAKPYFYHAQDSFPYFTNRIASNPVTSEGNAEDIDNNSPLVIIRLVVAHQTEGYRGQPESKMYEWGPVVKTYLQRRSNWLQCAAAPYNTRMDNLQQAIVTDAGGFRVFTDSGIGALQVGREIQVQCIFDEYIEQVYY